MSRTSVLNKEPTSILNSNVGDLTTAAPATALVSPYVELSTRLFGMTDDRLAVAFFAVHRGEGVTRTIRRLTAELARTEKRVAVLDGNLRPVTMAMNSHTADPQPHARPAVEIMAELRGRFDCILIDCGSLESSVSLWRVASVCDGVVLVVEAGRTFRDEVDRALQAVHQANGALLGFVLNKRRYPIPQWLYRFL